MYAYFSKSWLRYGIIMVWMINCLIASIIAVRQFWIPYMDAGADAYTKMLSDPFDGSVMPITYIPDWTKTENQDKSRRFEDIAISEFIPIPLYDALSLMDTTITNNTSMIMHYTYITPYMGSYRLNYKENDGSHLGVDIRAPIGTPVLSIANGVVVRTVEADATGNKFVVIRHDHVPLNGTNVSLYSGYLHLSEISVTEGTKIRKGEMLGRVGNSGIATTPHLHLQIDTADAPFHPYWPFTSKESRDAGLGFFESINSGLGKEAAEKYSIHPMNFINMYLGGIEGKKTEIYSSAPQNPTPITQIQSNTPTESSIQVAGREGMKNTGTCTGKRFTEVSEKSNLGKLLYPLVEERCAFQYDEVFNPKATLTFGDAIILLMDFYGIEKTSGTSHFLDIGIGETLQGYAQVAYRKGLADGNTFGAERIITKEEFIELIVKLGKFEKNPSQIKIYQDVDGLNPRFGVIQDYAYYMKARGGKISPKALMTKSSAVQMLSSIAKIQKQKK